MNCKTGVWRKHTHKTEVGRSGDEEEMRVESGTSGGRLEAFSHANKTTEEEEGEAAPPAC